MRAFLEKIEKDYLDDFVFTSKYELLNRGIIVCDFDGNDKTAFDRLNVGRADICIGSVQACERFFEVSGLEVPKYLGYPEELTSYYKRKIWTIDELPANIDKPLFVKPMDKVKEFTGCVIKDDNQLKFVKNYCPDITGCTRFYCSEVMNIVSEYRCFVHRGELMGIQWYAGDFREMLTVEMLGVIDCCISDYKSAPVAYTLDFAVIHNDDRTSSIALIEINDMWAVGSYGFNAKDYVRMTIDRFNEIKGIKTNQF